MCSIASKPAVIIVALLLAIGGQTRAGAADVIRPVQPHHGLTPEAAATIEKVGPVQSQIEQQMRAGTEAIASGQVPRVWQSRDGGFTTKATLVGVKDGTVQLQKENGGIVPIAIEKLSEADEEYVNKQIAAARHPETKRSALEQPSSAAQKSELELKCEDLCQQISKSYKSNVAGAKPTIAVVEFSNLSGGVTDLGRLLSEELTTNLFSTGNYKVIERLLLNKAIAEHKLQLQGLVDPKSAKELGKILGVDAIVSGTITDLGDSLRVNSRLISTETAEVFAVAAATIKKDEATKKLLSAGGEKMTDSASTASDSATRGKTDLPYREDFSSYKDGDNTDWGKGAKVVTGDDGRKWLAPAQKGQKPIGINVDLPDNCYIEFDYSVTQLENNSKPATILSGITLIDEAGAKFRIEWGIELERGFTPKSSLKLPGGTSVRSYTDSNGTILVRKTGNKIMIEHEGNNNRDNALSADISDFRRFVRFEVDSYKGPNSMIGFTNIKIGGSNLDGSKASKDSKLVAPKPIRLGE